MPYFSLDSFTKDTSSSGLSEEIFNQMTSSGHYIYTASDSGPNEARNFYHTGSAIIFLEEVFDSPKIQLSNDGTGGANTMNNDFTSSVSEYYFTSKYPFTFVTQQFDSEQILTTGSFDEIGFKNGSIPFQTT